MTHAERLVRWNQWYDRAPADWRFQFVLWTLLTLGAINLLLTVLVRFPFALLVVLGIAFLTVVRLPYMLGWILPTDAAAAGDTAPATFQIDGANWIANLNRRYDATPESRRFWIFPAILLIAGGINMVLTINNGFPFGLLFLLALLALVILRAPYAAGWFRTQEVPSMGPVEPSATAVEHTPMTAIASDMPPPAHLIDPADQEVAPDLRNQPDRSEPQST